MITPPSVAKATAKTLQTLSEQRGYISSSITDHYFRTHPECSSADVDKIRRICQTDTEHHLDFLHSALRLGMPEIFGNYMAWLKNVLLSRNLDTSHTLEALSYMREIMEQLFQGKELAKVRSTIDAGIEDFDKTSDLITQLPRPPTGHKLQGSEHYTLSLLDGRRNDANQLVSELMQQGKTLSDVSVELMQPAMYEVGRLWQTNKITVAQEHLATATTQYILSKAYAEAEFANPNNRRAAIACVEHNYHSLGARMVSDAFETQGWDVNYLGENNSAQILIETLDLSPVDILGLSISLQDQVDTLADTVGLLRSELGSRCPVIAIGGLPLNAIPGLALKFDVDAWFPDARAAAKDAK